MRDLKRAIRSTRHKIHLLGYGKFILKSFEVILITILSMITFKLRKSGCRLQAEFIDSIKIANLQSTEEKKKAEKIFEGIVNYNYQIFNYQLNFRSVNHLEFMLDHLAHLMDECEYTELKHNFSSSYAHCWNVDPLHGFKFDTLSIPYNKAEIKIPWELGRFNFYPQLAIYIEDVDKLAFIFSRDIISFFSCNSSTDNSVQWANAMEAGIRIFNILKTYSILKNRNATFLLGVERILSSGINLHFKYITCNNEFSFIQTSNHFAANILGLAAINYQYKSRFLSFILPRLLVKEVFRNTDSGLLNEGSTAYHRFTSEIYLSAYSLLRNSGMKKNQELECVFCKMANIVSSIENPLGLHTQFGDSDGGHLNWIAIPFSKKLNAFTPYDVANYEKFISVCFGMLNIELPTLSKDNVIEVANAQLYVVKKDGIYLAINNIRPSDKIYNKTHFHDDHGFVEFFDCGKPVLIDPGTYCYTSNLDLRRRFQSSEVHFNNNKFQQIDNPFADFFRPLNEVLVEMSNDSFKCTVFDNSHKTELVAVSVDFRKNSVEFKIHDGVSSGGTEVFLNYLSEPYCVEN